MLFNLIVYILFGHCCGRLVLKIIHHAQHHIAPDRIVDAFSNKVAADVSLDIVVPVEQVKHSYFGLQCIIFGKHLSDGWVEQKKILWIGKLSCFAVQPIFCPQINECFCFLQFDVDVSKPSIGGVLCNNAWANGRFCPVVGNADGTLKSIPSFTPIIQLQCITECPVVIDIFGSIDKIK